MEPRGHKAYENQIQALAIIWRGNLVSGTMHVPCINECCNKHFSSIFCTDLGKGCQPHLALYWFDDRSFRGVTEYC